MKDKELRCVLAEMHKEITATHDDVIVLKTKWDMTAKAVGCISAGVAFVVAGLITIFGRD